MDPESGARVSPSVEANRRASGQAGLFSHGTWGLIRTCSPVFRRRSDQSCLDENLISARPERCIDRRQMKASRIVTD
jgi:hypothetical protein